MNFNEFSSCWLYYSHSTIGLLSLQRNLSAEKKIAEEFESGVGQ